MRLKHILFLLLLAPAITRAGDMPTYTVMPRWDKAHQLVYVTVLTSFECCDGEPFSESLEIHSLTDHKKYQFDLILPPGAEQLLSEQAKHAFEDNIQKTLNKIKSSTEPLTPFQFSKTVQRKILSECSNHYFNTMVEKLVEPWKESCTINLDQNVVLTCHNTYHELGRKRASECVINDSGNVVLTIHENSVAGLMGLQLFRIPETQNWIGVFDFSDPFHTPVFGKLSLVSTAINADATRSSLPQSMNSEVKTDLQLLRRTLQDLTKLWDSRLFD